jgi:CubicO group peptidase (beta-lactamase class C family)
MDDKLCDIYQLEHKFKPIGNNNLFRAIKYVKRKANEIITSNLIPGIGIGITSSNKVLAIFGKGISDIKTQEPYTIDTILLNASTSKPISGTLLCMLDPTTDKILSTKADIEMSIDYITDVLTVRDLVTHHSGIPEQYGTYTESVGYSRKQIIRTLANATNSHFRDSHKYTNIPFSQGVQIGINAAGLSLSQAYNGLFQYLDMKDTSITFIPNKYKGYVDLRLLGQFQSYKGSVWYPAYNVNVEQQTPAGGIYSTVTDMIKFVMFQLEQSLLIQEERVINQEFYEGVYIIRADGRTNSIGINIVYQSIGNTLYKLFRHSGELENTRSFIEWIPQLNIGLFIHTNSCPNGIPEALNNAFLAILGGDSDSEADSIFESTNKAITDALVASSCKIYFTLPCMDCAKECIKGIDECLIGKYHNNEYGYIEIFCDGFIRVGLLELVKLHLCNGIYKFLLCDISKLKYLGKLTPISRHKVSMTYQCINAIYRKC